MRPVGTSARVPGASVSGAARARRGGRGRRHRPTDRRAAQGPRPCGEAHHLDAQRASAAAVRFIRRRVCSASHSAARAPAPRHLVLVELGPASTPSAVTRCTVLRSPPKMPVSGDTSLATIQSAPFALRFLGCSTHVLGLGGKADDQRRPLAGPVVAMVLRMSGFSTRSRGAAFAALLDLLGGLRGDAPVGDGGGEHGDVGRQGGAHRAQHLHARSRRARPSRRRDRPGIVGPVTSVTRAPSARASAAMAAPACRTSGWRCSAPGRSARASGRW